MVAENVLPVLVMELYAVRRDFVTEGATTRGAEVVESPCLAHHVCLACCLNEFVWPMLNRIKLNCGNHRYQTSCPNKRVLQERAKD